MSSARVARLNKGVSWRLAGLAAGSTECRTADPFWERGMFCNGAAGLGLWDGVAAGCLVVNDHWIEWRNLLVFNAPSIVARVVATIMGANVMHNPPPGGVMGARGACRVTIGRAG